MRIIFCMRFLTFLLVWCVTGLGSGRGVAQAPESVMVVEAHSGRILMAGNSGAKRPVASLTKMATAVVALDWAAASGADPAEVMAEVPETVNLLGGPNPLALQPGDRISLRDALSSAMLGSDNLAALTVADFVGRGLLQRRGRDGDSVAVFIDEMNRLAKALGMSSTRFVNPHGLTGTGRQGYSTAADMARLAIHVMRKPAFSFIVRQKERLVTVHGTTGRRSFRVRNTNELLGWEGVVGIKTGQTTAAGQCLATCVERDPIVQESPDGPQANKLVTPRRLVVVVLGSEDRFGRTRALIREGWAAFDQWKANGSPMANAKREFLAVPNL
jgi:D-alanyl-D-alanine carboxypeptidase (penicillin-binding protein 5/6)